MQYTLQFRSDLDINAATAWKWITSFDGINTELAPVLSMTAPPNVRTIDDMDITYGQPLFRSWLKLFGLLPVDYSNLTLVELEDGLGFTECSKMGMMKFWQHERRILPRTNGCTLVDTLTFEPLIPFPLAKSIVKALFKHRHKKLREHLKG